MKLLKKHSQNGSYLWARPENLNAGNERERERKIHTEIARECERERERARVRESARECERVRESARESESARERSSNNFYTLSTIARKVYVIFLSVHLSSSLSFFLIFSHLFLIRSVYLSFSIFLHSFPSLSFSEYLSLTHCLYLHLFLPL
jgi:hypothetical protein